MYTSQFFSEADEAEISALIGYNALAALVSVSERGFDATHAPLLFEPDKDKKSLIGHMARPNDHWRHIAEGDPVLAIFRGPDAYVTPSLYEVEPDVPTWNYSAVHVSGTWEPVTDRKELRDILELSVDTYEAVRGTGWDMSVLPETLVKSLSRGVFAFRIHITRIEAAQKLSQDKCLRDVEAVAKGMTGCPTGAVGDAMKRVTIEKGKYQR